ncbi:hypothetical protein ACFFSW_05880 [Saccharothrix longispora]|uniref:Uncharacterized protein n=1 Tax=Saccharothrix longispora TaxID=33920 RepID=A0ABU1PU57_9PSEU|nr:hypothetical protein [Saccharothrix longispora]MDR6593976.1 hypothetical protein [Saccharothrix longispora]
MTPTTDPAVEAHRTDLPPADGLVRIEPGRYDWVNLVLAGDPAALRDLDATAWLHYRGGVDPEFLRVPPGAPGAARIGVPRRDDLVAVRLPDLPGVRVVEVTATRSAPGATHPLPLSEHFDNTGLTTVDALDAGGFNLWGNTFPAHDLPAPGGTSTTGGVPFAFPARAPDGRDNLRCRGQRIAVPPGRWDWVHVLGAAERRTEDPLSVHHADGSVRPQWLRVSDFWPETAPRFGELLAHRCRTMHYPRHVQRNTAPALWAQRVPLTGPDGVVALELPDNPALHVFAMTLQAGEGQPG